MIKRMIKPWMRAPSTNQITATIVDEAPDTSSGCGWWADTGLTQLVAATRTDISRIVDGSLSP
jgi:hypothetical protein